MTDMGFLKKLGEESEKTLSGSTKSEASPPAHADMGFLRKLGEESEKTLPGSRINGMTAEEYADMLDKKQDDGEPLYGQQPGAPMNDIREELPTTDIEDMSAPANQSRPADPYQPQNSPKRYSSDSYGNSSFMKVERDTRTIRERRLAVAAHSEENAPLGILGAVLGAFLASVIWAFVAFLGFVTWAGAPLVVAGAYFGYLLFARDIGTAGVFIIIVAAAAGVFFGNRLSYSVSIHQSRPADPTSSYSVVEELSSIKDIFTGKSKHFRNRELARKYRITLLYSAFAAVITIGILFLHRFR